jgi:arylsulfatase A-like enzyme
MPNLQGLAHAGTRFNRCYAPNPICSPTRASIFTGLFPHSHGVVDVTHAVEPHRADLKPGLPFWTRTLEEAGYLTGYFGKWHVERSDKLENFGFNEYEVDLRLVGLTEANKPLLKRQVVKQEGYKDFLLCGVTEEPAEASREHYLYSRGIEFLHNVTRKDSKKPWALFISTEAPHDPYIVPRNYYERYQAEPLPRPANFDDPLDDRPAIYRRAQEVWRDLGWEAFAEATTCYYALCSLIDDQIGRLLSVLRELDQEKNTLVVFISDHGDYLGAHRLMLKGVPAFEEAYRVPLIVKGPGVRSGQVINDIVSLIDLPRTLTRLTIGEDFACQGRDLTPCIEAGKISWEPEAFAEFHGQRFGYTQRILWRDRYKYVFNTFDFDELYNLDADPHELCNLAANPSYRDVAKQMAARMWQIVRETGDKTVAEAEYGMFRFAPVGPEGIDENKAS